MPANMSNRDEGLVEDVMRDFKELSGNRQTWETHWDEIAELIWPNMRNSFRPGLDFETPGEKKTLRQYDAGPQIALTQFGAILDSLLTPRNQQWHRLTATNEDLNKDQQVKEWFSKSSRALFKFRYASTANFTSQNQMFYQMLGGFGTGIMFIDELQEDIGLRYKAAPIGQCYIRENHQGIVDTVLRYFPLKARNAVRKWGEDRLPQSIVEKSRKNPDHVFWFIHRVTPRTDYDRQKIDSKNKPFESVYVSVAEKYLISEGGFDTFPYAVSRYEQAPNEVFGRSPAMLALPAVNTLMEQKKALLKQGHRAVDPVLLAHDDGVLNGVNLRPGAVNYGGIGPNGERLIDVLPTGDVQMGKDLMDDERQIINSAFLVHLFQILTETPRMTATEVLERTREKGILLAPTVGRQQSEYLGPLIDRELDILIRLGQIPEIPPALIEARGEYEVVYDSPLSRIMRAEEASGFLRAIEGVLPVIQTTGDVTPLDNYNFDVITRELADIQGVPPEWMNAPEVVQAVRQQRAEAAEREQQANEAPGAAALINAASKAKEKGVEVDLG